MGFWQDTKDKFKRYWWWFTCVCCLLCVWAMYPWLKVLFYMFNRLRGAGNSMATSVAPVAVAAVAGATVAANAPVMTAAAAPAVMMAM